MCGRANVRLEGRPARRRRTACGARAPPVGLSRPPVASRACCARQRLPAGRPGRGRERRQQRCMCSTNQALSMAPAAAEEALDLDRCLSAALEVATAAGDIIAEVGTDVACRVGGRPALLCAVASGGRGRGVGLGFRAACLRRAARPLVGVFGSARAALWLASSAGRDGGGRVPRRPLAALVRRAGAFLVPTARRGVLCMCCENWWRCLWSRMARTLHPPRPRKALRLVALGAFPVPLFALFLRG